MYIFTVYANLEFSVSVSLKFSTFILIISNHVQTVPIE